MIIAGIVVKVVSGKEEPLAEYLKGFPNVTVEGSTDGNLAIVVEANHAQELEKLTQRWQDNQEDIIGVFPVYVNSEDIDEDISRDC
ncbi:hypothetical protein BHU72_03625 [Desulfuribacillus stibiiarsenatis]|uniref:Uncharacterized protein n=1 Tax=Desulfuribacillus stibiiarsenatis TaxID=1390249 RepID=A0A1E5L751_9FIRM|nr:chaperone NapD [Desulfuribacillus stibiiarsenatis]OEH85878.1 hypothetical protein BHU72_03625 [Desulfuribacillus stibiiarsenatis]